MKGTATGRVSRADRDRFSVLTDSGEYTAWLRGAFFDTGERPVVGDMVEVTLVPGGDGMIERILPRKSVLRRADLAGRTEGFEHAAQEQVMVANIDYAFILTSLNENYNINRIARYVSVTLEGGAVPVVILTKADLCPDPAPYIAEVSALSPKVRVHAISTYTGMGLGELAEYLRPDASVALLGSSGVGKSTLVNRLAGTELMKTGDIREKDGKGRHTTTARQMFVLENGLTLIDTPGMRELGLLDAEGGVRETFPDIEALSALCRYSNCSHNKEPGCAVRTAIDSGELDKKRWKLYRQLMDESRRNTDMKAIAKERRRLNKSSNRRDW